MKTKFTSENLTLNVRFFCRHLFQDLDGDPKPEHKWPSHHDWKEWYPHLSSDSSSELGDDQEQVGHRNKVKRRYSFDMRFLLKIHFSSLLVVLINGLYIKDLLNKGYSSTFTDGKLTSVFLVLDHWTYELHLKQPALSFLLVSFAGLQSQ